jgi:hypothetical protein
MTYRIQKGEEGVAFERHELVWINHYFCSHGMTAESHSAMAASQRSLASSVVQQTRMQQIKDQMAALQIEFTMH